MGRWGHLSVWPLEVGLASPEWEVRQWPGFGSVLGTLFQKGNRIVGMESKDSFFCCF